MLVATACGSYSSTAAGGSDGPTLTIESPSNGDQVSTPFTVKVSSSEELGAPESGRDHWHLYFDGVKTDYTVETSDVAKVDSLAPGEHTIEASLQHADHSPAGAQDTITIDITGNGGDGATNNNRSESDTGY
jgi:hypothetical protein